MFGLESWSSDFVERQTFRRLSLVFHCLSIAFHWPFTAQEGSAALSVKPDWPQLVKDVTKVASAPVRAVPRPGWSNHSQ